MRDFYLILASKYNLITSNEDQQIENNTRREGKDQ